MPNPGMNVYNTNDNTKGNMFPYDYLFKGGIKEVVKREEALDKITIILI